MLVGCAIGREELTESHRLRPLLGEGTTFWAFYGDCGFV